MVSGNFDRRLLKLEHLLTKFTGDSKFSETGACFLRQMIRHLDIDVIRRNRFFARPAFFNDVSQFIRDIQTPMVVPAIFKPQRQLLAGIMVKNIYV